MPAETPEAFVFHGCAEIRESLGIRVDSERQLLDRLETVPAESIYHHTVRSLLRRQVVPTPYPDDFASWVSTEVGDAGLAEKLALPSPFDFADIEGFRQHLLEVLDDHLAELRFDPRVILGSPFYFQRGHLAEVPLEVSAVDLRGFGAALAEIDGSAIYFHAVEAIGRLGNPRGDFAAWFEDVLGLGELAGRVRQVDPFVLSLDRVRHEILDLVDLELARQETA